MLRADRAIEAQTPEHVTLLQRLFTTWGTDPAARNPCSLPRSLDAASLRELGQHQYWVTPKADGHRFQLLLTTGTDDLPIAVLIDRKLHMWEVEILGCAAAFTGSLLDGELVCGTFQIFDAMAICGRNVCKEPMASRLQALHQFIGSAPCSAEELDEGQKIVACDGEVPLAVKHMRLKTDFAALRRLEWPYPTDGWIFTRDDAAVAIGTAYGVLKWKPKHTVDVLLNPPRVYDAPTESLVEVDAEVQQSQSTDATSVYECELLALQPLALRVMQARQDKTLPNSNVTLERTVRSVREQVTEDQLAALCSQ
jgi:hypothetical protein